jgi:hypothetical protein
MTSVSELCLHKIIGVTAHFRPLGFIVVARGSLVGWGTMLQVGSPDEVIGFLSIDLIFPAALWPWCRLSL